MRRTRSRTEDSDGLATWLRGASVAGRSAQRVLFGACLGMCLAVVACGPGSGDGGIDGGSSGGSQDQDDALRTYTTVSDAMHRITNSRTYVADAVVALDPDGVPFGAPWRLTLPPMGTPAAYGATFDMSSLNCTGYWLDPLAFRGVASLPEPLAALSPDDWQAYFVVQELQIESFPRNYVICYVFSADLSYINLWQFYRSGFEVGAPPPSPPPRVLRQALFGGERSERGWSSAEAQGSATLYYTPAGAGGGTGNDGPYLPNYLDELHPALHWPGLPVSVFIEHSGLWTASREQAFLRGLESWNAAMPSRVLNVVGTALAASILVRFVESSGSAEGGHAETLYSPETFLVDEAAITMSAQFDGAELSAEDIQTVAAHELGHALGLNGHSPNSDDLMYYAFTVAGAVRRPTQNDVNTLRSIYAAIARTPTVTSAIPGERVTVVIQ